MTKIRLSFYTNIPTPYQQDFFEALSVYFDLTVVYYAKTEIDRQWSIKTENRPYQIHYLTDTIVARWIQKRLKDYHYSWSIIRLLARDKADYVIFSGAYWIPNTMTGIIISKIRKKTIAFFGERLTDPGSPFKKYLKKMSLIPAKWACQHLFVGGKEAAQSYQSYGFTSSISIIPYNIDITRFNKSNLNQEKFNKIQTRYKLTSQLVLLSSGSLIKRKNMATLIKAVKDSNTAISFVIIGEGDERRYLEELIGNDERIHLAGFVQASELPYYYNLADVFVFASRYDGWGVVINEAIAAGLPIISSENVGAAREWLINGINGFVCPPNDTKAFRQSIEKLVNTPDLLESQAAYNRSFRDKTSSTHYAGLMYEAIKQDLRG
ncbi:glycosyltransferase family 4 protein [Larkinella punicea]|uniref:Glycosyltransferase n=1 Tax=Larkinella punicea TaxID=2315727 RepID=A0A368JHI8_9BACT|nr:glycosyltransferase family 4 protein [Larkinella punicea]RCR67138.1 glycosyltransferase [Larkinella punicea]